ncbi:MAG: oxygen-independent coproporphyrinogen III oxidase-like protein [Thiothrix sp.]|nr:oxygen-independent coproporphyrinogen III oxidase-like protein [Thiothrix sp.]HPQ94670.1 radical SAM family heme chaperone HemW [Thiolinea sp.]
MTPIPLSLYIHIPWCIRKCPYCDFNSHPAPAGVSEQEQDYVHALLQDLSEELPAIWGRRLESVFIGGGTPSLFSARALDDLLGGIRALLPLRPDMEITLEANPGTFEQARFRDFRATGINRLSIGIQSFNPQHLQQLGRIHNREEALRAVDIARKAGFDNLNLDLMFALPQQTQAQAMADLQQAVDLAPEHLSWYQLTLEPNTEFYKYPPSLPDDDLSADMQLSGQALLKDSCYAQYEVSAYARSGRQCRHNLNYWTFGDYVGIGAGAHGKITQTDHTVLRYRKFRQPARYLAQARSGGFRSNEQRISASDLTFEFMLNALRLRTGFTPELFARHTGLAPDTITPALELAVSRGLLALEPQIHATAHGWRYLNEAIQLFLED